jgi:predicted nucleotidyltransferase
VADLSDLPQEVRSGLEAFVAATRAALGDDVISITLFGSAAEGRLRATSDVNVALVLKRFDTARIDGLREALRFAHATIGLETMFLLASEVSAARDAFAVKFLDIEHRHRVLYGSDPFQSLGVEREAILRRVKQVLLNLTLRLRERYATVSLREEQAARVVADAAGPLRASAMALLKLEGRSADTPRAALEIVARETGEDFGNDLVQISNVRERGLLPHGEAGPLLARTIELASRLSERAQRIA